MEVSNCLKRRNAVGSRKLGCQVTMKTKLIQLSSGQTALEISIPSLKAHLATHDSKINFYMNPYPETEEKLYSLVQGACLPQVALIVAVQDWVKELILRHLKGQITKTPSEYSRAYFPTKDGIRSMA